MMYLTRVSENARPGAPARRRYHEPNLTISSTRKSKSPLNQKTVERGTRCALLAKHACRGGKAPALGAQEQKDSDEDTDQAGQACFQSERSSRQPLRRSRKYGLEQAQSHHCR